MFLLYFYNCQTDVLSVGEIVLVWLIFFVCDVKVSPMTTYRGIVFHMATAADKDFGID